MLRVLIALLLIAYPFAVYYGLQWFSVRHIALVIMALLILRLATLKKLHTFNGLQWPVFAGVLLVSLAWLMESRSTLKLYPALINLVLLAWFVQTLFVGPPAIERFARLQDPDLDEFGVRYTRTVTKVWCVFFVFNATMALYTALSLSEQLWMLYNGFIAYVLMGLLFAVEWIVRKILQRKNQSS